MRGDLKLRSKIRPDAALTRNVAAGVAGSIKAGEPTKSVDAAAASPYLGTVAICVDGDGTTSQRFTGIAKSDSSDTVAAAGEVMVYMPYPGVQYSGKAKTASLVNTQALIDALKGKRVVFDLTASVWTIDSAAADAVVNAVVILGGDYRTGELAFVYAPHATFLDFAISA